MVKIAKDVRQEIDEDVVMSTITDAITASEISIKVDTTEIKGYTDEVEAKVDTAQSIIQTDISDTRVILKNRKYEKVFYVSKTGDDTNGLSWDTAFTTVEAAYAASTPTGVTMINVGAGTFEIAPTGNFLLIENKIHLRGAGPESTIFMSLTGDSGSDYVFKCQNTSTFEDFSFHGHGLRSYGMIYFYGAPGSMVQNVLIEDRNENYNDCYMFYIRYSDRCILKNIKIRGGTTKIQGIALDNSKDCKFENIDVWDSGRGIWVQGGGSERNEFIDVRTYECSMGVQLSAGNRNHFEGCKIIGSDTYGFNIAASVNNTRITDTKFAHNAKNIHDFSTTTALTGIVSDIKNQIYPDNLIGVNLPNSGIADTYGANTPIIPAGTIDKPFRILAYTAAPTDDKKFIVRLSADSGVTHFIHMIDRRDGNTGELGRILVLNDGVFAKDTEISGSQKTEVIDETIDVWLYYQEI